MRVILAGATGLVGGAIARLLPPDTLTIVARRAVEGVAARQLIGPMEDWPRLMVVEACDFAICCLGTTIRQAWSKEAFAAVDLEGVTAFASAARMAGAKQFMLVSSVGANAEGSNFYLQTKGRAEAAVQGMDFNRVDIFRPGLLRGERTGPARAGESLAMALSPVTDLLPPRGLDKYRSIAATTVAQAICALAGLEEEGVFIHHNRDMLREATAIG